MLRPTLPRLLRATPVAPDFARMQLIGRLVQDPEVRTTKGGKEYARYVVATTDPAGPADASGERPPPTTSFHNIFAFGEPAVQRLAKMTKGTQVFVEADFRLQKVGGDEGGDASTANPNVLVQHRSIQTISKPKTSIAN